MNVRSTKFLVLLLALIVFVAVLASILAELGAPRGSVAVISVDSQVRERIDLNQVTEPYSFVVESEWGRNTVEVEPGRIRVSEADCPDQICVEQGWVEPAGSPIVCLPHRMVIQFTEGEGGVDAVS